MYTVLAFILFYSRIDSPPIVTSRKTISQNFVISFPLVVVLYLLQHISPLTRLNIDCGRVGFK